MGVPFIADAFPRRIVRRLGSGKDRLRRLGLFGRCRWIAAAL
jgi:hypothetical protein